MIYDYLIKKKEPEGLVFEKSDKKRNAVDAFLEGFNMYSNEEKRTEPVAEDRTQKFSEIRANADKRTVKEPVPEPKYDYIEGFSYYTNGGKEKADIVEFGEESDTYKNWKEWLYFDGELIGADKVGNMNMAYVGKKMGLPEWVYKNFETMDKDDPKWVKRGISLAKYGR